MDVLEHVVRLLCMGLNTFQRVDDVEFLSNLEHRRCWLDRIVVCAKGKLVDDVAEVVVVSGSKVGHLYRTESKRVKGLSWMD